jgi:dipeptidyl aminopeptidase/acylaminoacyl peptidase
MEENGITGKKFKIGKMMWQDFKDVNPILSLNKIKCPVLTIVGSEDDSIELDKTRKYLDMILAEQELVVIDGGGHDFLIEEAKKELLQISSNFIKKYL